MNSSPSDRRALVGQLLVLALLVLLAAGFLLFIDGLWDWASDPVRIAWACALVLGFVAAWSLGAWRRRVRADQHGALARAEGPLPIFYASQTGYAQALARLSAQALQSAGTPAQAISLDTLTPDTLAALPRALFVLSTTGEGDPPDAVAGFVRRTLSASLALHGLRYAVLALGDRHYSRFCAFGHRMDAWLAAQGAHALFPCIEVDNGDPAALDAWRDALSSTVAHVALSAPWQIPQWQTWRLAQRVLLNPGSQGEATYHLQLLPEHGRLPEWRAGDIAEILPRQGTEAITRWLLETGLDGQADVGTADGRMALADWLARCELPDPSGLSLGPPETIAQTLTPLRPRDYSIASIPGDGRLDLLIRQSRRPDGRLGVGAGWLTAFAPVNADIAVRLRSNPNFHAPEDNRPLILIGNGTGLAGLRALLRERIAQGRHANWLLFGERQREHDFYYRNELTDARDAGHLVHLDLAFSRDGTERRYVQNLLQLRAERLVEWIRLGAAIYVCGSLQGMAGGVDACLRGLLGDAGVQRLTDEGRYRRDVY